MGAGFLVLLKGSTAWAKGLPSDFRRSRRLGLRGRTLCPSLLLEDTVVLRSEKALLERNPSGPMTGPKAFP